MLTLQSLCPVFYLSHPKEVTRTTPKKQAGKLQCSQAQLGHRENEKPGHNIASLPPHSPVLFVDLIPKAHCAHNSQLEIDIALLKVVGAGFQLDPRL